MAINYDEVKTVAHRLSNEVRRSVKSWLFTHNLSNDLDPAEIVLILTNRCNMHCKMYDFPRRKFLNDELTTAEWLNIIGDIKRLFPQSTITLTGGQCTLRKDLISIKISTNNILNGKLKVV